LAAGKKSRKLYTCAQKVDKVSSLVHSRRIVVSHYVSINSKSLIYILYFLTYGYKFSYLYLYVLYNQINKEIV